MDDLGKERKKNRGEGLVLEIFLVARALGQAISDIPTPHNIDSLYGCDGGVCPVWQRDVYRRAN